MLTKLVPSSISSNFDKVKVQVTGSFLEVYAFQFPINHSVRPHSLRTFNPDNIRKGNTRAISAIRTIVAGNFNSFNVKFITLTFKNTAKFDIKNLSVCNERKKTFIKKLQSMFGYNFKYLIVPEYQVKTGRMAVHYHILADIGYIDYRLLNKLWPYGMTDIHVVVNPGPTGDYMSKEFTKQLSSYVSKEIKAGLTKGFRRYYCSNSVVRPDVFYGAEARRLLSLAVTKNPILIETREFLIEYQGYCVYNSYRLSSSLKNTEIDKFVYYYG
jgi:hypothetical protein